MCVLYNFRISVEKSILFFTPHAQKPRVVRGGQPASQNFDAVPVFVVDFVAAVVATKKRIHLEVKKGMHAI